MSEFEKTLWRDVYTAKYLETSNAQGSADDAFRAVEDLQRYLGSDPESYPDRERLDRAKDAVG